LIWSVQWINVFPNCRKLDDKALDALEPESADFLLKYFEAAEKGKSNENCSQLYVTCPKVFIRIRILCYTATYYLMFYLSLLISVQKLFTQYLRHLTTISSTIFFICLIFLSIYLGNLKILIINWFKKIIILYVWQLKNNSWCYL
jgi:hypothetical protein